MSSSIHIVVIASDEHSSLLCASIEKEFPTATLSAVGDHSALMSILKSLTPDIVFCDWSIESMNPTDVCSNLLTGAATSATLVVAVVRNQYLFSVAVHTHVHHIIDLSDEVHSERVLALNLSLLQRFEDVRLKNLVLENEVRSKESGERQIIKALEKTIQVRFPEAADCTPFIVSAVEWIVDQFRNEEDAELEKTQVLYAAQLAWLGKMHLPDAEKHNKITLEGVPTNAITAFVPMQADTLLDGVDALAGARTILKNVYENYDGTGFPDRKQHWQIPLGSRVLRAVCDLEEIARTSRMTFVEALEVIKKFNRRVYDHRVVALLEEYLTNVSKRSRDHSDTRAIALHDLHEGMTLASDVVTNSGLKLINAGTILRENLIVRIQSHNAMDPILGNIYVRNS